MWKGNADRGIIIVLAMMTCACNANTSPTPPMREHPGERDPLTGVWEMSLHIEEPPADSVIPDIDGTVALIRADPLRTSAYARSQQLDHVGVYNAALEPIGVEPIPNRDVPVAFAQMVSPDSFVLTLNPGVSHGAAVLQGSIRGEEASGSWQVTAYAAGPRGTFRMRRIR